MDRNELKKMVDSLPYTRRMASTVDEITKAQVAAGIDSLFDYIGMQYNIKPKLSIIPKEDTLHDFLKEVYDSGYKFEDCDEPEMLRDFCAPSPHSGNREMTYAEMSSRQQSTVRLIAMKYRLYKKPRKDLFGGNTTIEDALDSRIKVRVKNETGKDTPE